jgi:hypothetical protein
MLLIVVFVVVVEVASAQIQPGEGEPVGVVVDRAGVQGVFHLPAPLGRIEDLLDDLPEITALAS